MADPIYTSASPIAVNPANGELIGGATFTVHAPDDTSFSTPLAVTDPNTGVAINPLRSNSNGTLPSFKVAGDLARVKLKSGGFVTELVSLDGLVAEQITNAGLDSETVSAAIAAAGTATTKAGEASAAAQTAEDAATLASQKASAVAEVVATNDGIMSNVLDTPGTVFGGKVDQRIEDGVAAAVPEVMGSDPVIREAASAAAATAVTGEVVSRNLVESTDTRVAQLAADDAIAFAVTDEAGHASWMAVTPSGGLPAYAAAIVRTAIDAPRLEEDSRVTAGGKSFVVVDDQDRQSPIALDANGNLHPDFLAAIAAGLGGIVRPLPGLSVAGDSISAITPSYSSGLFWSQMVADAIGAPLWNPSVPGEASADIGVRVGAITPTVVVSGNQIPAAATPVSVTISAPSDGYRVLTDGSAQQIGDFVGVLHGIPGRLKHLTDGSNGWTFTRTTAGPAPIDVPSTGGKFVMQEGKSHRNDVWILWPGRNNPNQAQVLRDLATMVSFIGEPKRFLVLSVLRNDSETIGTGGYTTNVALNDAIAAAYPSSYVDVQAYLIANGLADAGLTATSQDTTDIANGIIPTSLRADATHPNRYGQIGLRNRILTTLTQKAWVLR